MKEYVAIIEKNFPPGSKWRKHLNKHTLKLSYSCTKNLGSIISSHNKKVLGGQVEKAGCNCRNPPCPLDGECLTEGLVYWANLKTLTKIMHILAARPTPSRKDMETTNLISTTKTNLEQLYQGNSMN